MRSLMFCRDGVLRLRQGVYDRAERRHYPILLPFTEMEDRWPGMFLSLLDASLELEDGLDVREALLNLAPWSVEVSAITNCRFDLFLNEVRKPLTEDHFADLDTLGFVYHQEIAAEPDFDGGFEDTLTRIPGSRMYEMRQRKPRITDRIELGGAWHCAGYRKGTAAASISQARGHRPRPTRPLKLVAKNATLLHELERQQLRHTVPDIRRSHAGRCRLG